MGQYKIIPLKVVSEKHISDSVIYSLEIKTVSVHK